MEYFIAIQDTIKKEQLVFQDKTGVFVCTLFMVLIYSYIFIVEIIAKEERKHKEHLDLKLAELTVSLSNLYIL